MKQISILFVLALLFSAQTGDRVREKITIIAHRGNSITAPENTLIALREAFEIGAEIAEIDVHLSNEGTPVIIHDKTVDRTTNGKGTVADMTVAELKRLDAGAWKSSRYAGEKIPTLQEALKIKNAMYLLDLKQDNMGAKIAETYRKSGVAFERAYAGAWNEAQIRDMQKHLPGAKIFLSGALPENWNPAWIDDWRTRGLAGFEVGDIWPQEFLDAAHARKLPVFAYTINTEKLMRKLILMGIDGIETDDPALAVRIVKEFKNLKQPSKI